MLDLDLVPSQLVAASEVTQVKIVPLKRAGRFQTMRLVASLVGLGIFLAWSRLARQDPEWRAIRVREFLEDQGGLWVKAGQLLSLRNDLFSRAMVDELSELAYRAHGFSPEVARQVVEESIGVPIEHVFDAFDPHPFAAASISQVHQARLRKNGVKVAIKVQRPGIDRVLARDLKLISFMIRMARRIPTVSYISWDAFVGELHRVVAEEIDYRYEVSNLRRMRRTLREHKVCVPKVYRRLSGRQIIVMEFIDGVLMSDYNRVVASDPRRVERWCEDNDIRPHKVGSRLLRSFYRQIFEDNLFHGDLHPGNIVLLRESRFALIDLGSIGSVEQRFMENYRRLQLAFSEGDYSKAFDYFLLSADSVPPFDVASFKAEATARFKAWEARSHLEGLTYRDKSLSGEVANDLTELARRYRINPSWQLLQVGRALSTLDANLTTLLGDRNPNKIIQRYFREYRKRTFKRIRAGGVIKKVLSGLSDARAGFEFATTSLRQSAISVQGVQRKIDAVVTAVTSVLRVLLSIALFILVYDMLHDHNKLPPWAHIASLDRLAVDLRPYPVEFAVLFVLLGFYVVRQVSKVRRRYKQPTYVTPDRRRLD